MVVGKLPVPGRPANLDNSGTRAYYACGGCMRGLLGHCSLIYHFSFSLLFSFSRWWSGGAMVLGKLPVPGRPAYLE